MEKKTRRQALLAKIEATYGDDAAPAAANAILAKNLSIKPLEGQNVSRDLVRPTFGNDMQIPVGTHVSCGFDVELAGSGTGGAAPGWGVLMRACGFAEAILTGLATVAASPPVAGGAPVGAFTYVRSAPFAGTADRVVTLTCTLAGGSGVAEFTVSAPGAGNLGAHLQTDVAMTDGQAFALGGGAEIEPTITDPFDVGDVFTIALKAPAATYTPISTGHESITIYINKDGTLHKLAGARGSVSLKVEAAQLPMLTFAFKGLFEMPAAGALPAVDTSAFQAPIPASTANTPVIALHGVTSPMQSINIDMAIDAKFIARVGRETVQITDRKPKATIQIEDPGTVPVNFFQRAAAAAMGTLALQHGTQPGGIIEVAAGQVQVFNPDYADADGLQMLQMELALVPSDAGDDEITITVK